MIPKRFLVSAFACAFIFVSSRCGAVATQEAQAAVASGIQPAPANPQQLQQLVAPIALYPDELVAEVLAASTYPTEVVQANRWLQQNSTLKTNNWPPRWTNNPGMRASKRSRNFLQCWPIWIKIFPGHRL